MQICVSCGAEFAPYPVVDGVKLNLHGRKYCTDCKPLRHLTRPRKPVVHARAMRPCKACGQPFPVKAVIDGRMRSFYRRRFCLGCSPFGAHNTSRRPPGELDSHALIEHRRRRRSATTYRSQKKRRRIVKATLVAAAGGRCIDCAYAGSPQALDFHHRDPADKAFAISGFSGSWERLSAEAQKCDLLCANCHRIRHALEDASIEGTGVITYRRNTKAKAVSHMGAACFTCSWKGPAAVFEFHHRDGSSKDFGIGQDGIARPWSKIAAELAKCVMLCANCHREVHAGVRELDGGLLGLAEDALPYVA